MATWPDAPGSRARENLLAFCEALGGYVAGACAVRVRLLKVEGQESNVVVVAEATEREKKSRAPSGAAAPARRARRRFRFFAGGGARGAVRGDRLEVSASPTSPLARAGGLRLSTGTKPYGPTYVALTARFLPAAEGRPLQKGGERSVCVPKPSAE